MPPTTPYRIETRRLILRCYRLEDAGALDGAIRASLPELEPFMPWAAHEPLSLPERVELLRRFRGEYDLDVNYVMGVFSLDSQELWGGTGLHPRIGPDALEIGYWIHSKQTGRGLATELSAALTRVAFTHFKKRRVEIHCAPENRASARVPEKLGFTDEGTRRANSFDVQGRPRDTRIFTMLAPEFPASAAAAASKNIVVKDGLGHPFFEASP